MSETKQFSFVKPTLQTLYHIDFEWWKSHDSNWHIFLFGCLCEEHQKLFDQRAENAMIDWINPETAEVTLVDGLQTVLMSHCAKLPNFVTPNTTMIDAIFRVFLANGNTPMTPPELSDRIGKPADTILRTLSGFQVYKGIRPFHG
ncbi:hypothetical protein EG832_18125 [bacterium]|nr:hypothetical protein [bacterium]